MKHSIVYLLICDWLEAICVGLKLIKIFLNISICRWIWIGTTVFIFLQSPFSRSIEVFIDNGGEKTHFAQSWCNSSTLHRAKLNLNLDSYFNSYLNSHLNYFFYFISYFLKLYKFVMHKKYSSKFKDL